MKLVVTGTIGIDTVHTPRERREALPGGSACYFAAAASLLAPVRMVAVVGEDWPASHEQALRSFSRIDLRGLERRAGARTFAWGGRYLADPNQRETLFTEVGVLAAAPPPVPPEFADSQLVFLANTHPTVQLNFLSQFPSRQLVVADTMNLWIATARTELMQLIGRVDGLVLNDAEARQLTDRPNAVSAAREILDCGPRFVIVKKGEHGAVLVHRDGLAVVPAFPADESQIVDPTGAGDAFAGGLMAHLSNTGDFSLKGLQSAMAWGTVVASFTIESFGLERLQALGATDLETRHAALREMARFA